MKKFSLFLLISILAVFLMAGSGNALMLELSSGVDTVTIFDGIGVDDDLDGRVSFDASIGDFVLSATIGLSKPFIGEADHPYMDLFSLNVTSGVQGGSITITLMDDGFFPTSPDPWTVVSEIGGTTAGTVTYHTLVNNTLHSDLGSFSGGAFSSTLYSELMDDGGPFSLSIITTIEHTGGSLPKVTSFDASVAIPEPATMLLFGCGLIGLAVVGRKKFK